MSEDKTTRSFEEFSRITRGETPDDIQEKCLKLCADYLAGVWAKISIQQILIRRISGGLTNQLYYCGLAQGIEPIGKEPKEVTIRLYGKKWFNGGNSNERLSDMIIILMASELNLGPKIYGVSNDAEIGEYIECHQFRVNDQNDPKLVKLLSQKLSRFHSLSVPLPKNGDWLKNYFNEFYEKAYKEFPIDDVIKEINAENLLKRNIKDEYEWLLRCIDATNSPIVFSHNDFRGSNLLVHDIIEEKNSRIISLCDFEYSCYYYRGFDLGVCLDEFGRIRNRRSASSFASDEVLEAFLSGYLDESIKIYGEEYGVKEENSIKHLINETKVFALAGQMFIIMFLMGAREPPFTNDKKVVMRRVNNMFGIYLEHKALFHKEGVLPISP